MHLIVFQIENQLLALELSEVDRVILAAEITPFSGTSDRVMGVINMHGEILPVINLRKIIGLPEKDLDITDHFLISKVGGHRIALWIDSVKKVDFFVDKEMVPKDQLFSKMDQISWAFKDEGKIIFVYKIEKLLPMEILTLFMKAS
jgi:purine-binding chemotaxis protein CheW